MKPEPKKKLRLDDVWREAKDLVWARRARLGIGLVLMLISRVTGMVLPATSKYLVDDVIGKGKHDLLPLLALAAGAATIIQAITSFALSQILGVAAQRAITEMRKRVEEHVLRLPVSYFDSTKSGVLISRIMTDAEGIRNIVGTGLVQLVGSLVTAAIALFVLLYLNWSMTLITIATLAVFGSALAIAFKKVRPLFRKRGEINAQVTGRLAESLGGIRVVKAYTTEKREDIVFAKGVHNLFRNVAQTITSISGISAFGTVIFGVVGMVMMLLGGRAIIAHRMTLGDFVMYVFFTGLLAMPIMNIASIGTQITEAFAGLDRIREIMKLKTELDEDASRDAVSGLRGDVTFDDVTFEYDPGVPVLKHISFHAPARTTTALVGSSGSGKSTLISLIMTFNRPQSGAVRIDGVDLATLRLRDYRSHLGIVLQDNFLFDGTIAENIRYGRPDATFEEMLDVARIAHVDEFVEPLEKKYETVIGERGIKLSGGQRQRIAIARAILANPSILILDEATSSLDSESEAKIQDGLRALRRGRTTFVIAHRLSTIRGADQILVLEAGEIVERGTHAELLARNGRYKQLYDRQYNFETDRFINPGEDFLPVPEPVAAVRGGGSGAL
ncbi:MAG TPA: ABC transporter ATP-binding protein [Thermoanaerobaculia bacterium]|nr:ABC transporter ATP-binding protein [Thermoanaerobaculia bacterium]